MKTPYVTVQLASKTEPGIYAGREYTYVADHRLSVGDVVFVDTRLGGTLGKVTAVDVPEQTIEPKIRTILKHITGHPIDPEKLPKPRVRETHQLDMEEVSFQ